MKQNLKIIKPKTRPIQIEPWFFRYLTLLELKVVGAILAYADIKDRQSNSFPSNRTIAFFCGNDVIEENTKTYKKYSSLNEKEKEDFINQKIKYSINTIKQAKKSLEKKGLLTREIVGPKGKQIVYMTLDLEWKKEQYLKEHDKFFNNITHEENENEKEDIAAELEELQRLTIEGNISKDNLANRLKNLSNKLNSTIENPTVPVEDIEKVATYIMNTSKVQNKIDKGEIENKDAYKKSIVKSISTNLFNGVDKYYEALVKKEQKDMLETLTISLEQNENENFDQRKNILYFKDLTFTNNIFLATYESKDKNISKQFIISDEKIKYYLHTSYFYTKPNKELLENYLQSITEYQNMLKNSIEKKNESNTS